MVEAHTKFRSEESPEIRRLPRHVAGPDDQRHGDDGSGRPDRADGPLDQELGVRRRGHLLDLDGPGRDGLALHVVHDPGGDQGGADDGRRVGDAGHPDEPDRAHGLGHLEKRPGGDRRGREQPTGPLSPLYRPLRRRRAGLLEAAPPEPALRGPDVPERDRRVQGRQHHDELQLDAPDDDPRGELHRPRSRPQRGHLLRPHRLVRRHPVRSSPTPRRPTRTRSRPPRTPPGRRRRSSRSSSCAGRSTSPRRRAWRSTSRTPTPPPPRPRRSRTRRPRRRSGTTTSCARRSGRT